MRGAYMNVLASIRCACDLRYSEDVGDATTGVDEIIAALSVAHRQQSPTCPHEPMIVLMRVGDAATDDTHSQVHPILGLRERALTFTYGGTTGMQAGDYLTISHSDAYNGPIRITRIESSATLHFRHTHTWRWVEWLHRQWERLVWWHQQHSL